MDSIANQIQAYKTDRPREVAYELKLPFLLKELSEDAEEGVREAHRTRGGKLYQDELLQHFKNCIDNALVSTVSNGSLQEDEKTGKESPPDERIREALKTFPKAKEWEHLLEGCGHEEAWALKFFLNTNRDELEGSLVKKELQGIEYYALKRRFVLALSHKKARFINTSGPFWAAIFWRRAREENMSGVKPGPHDPHTVPERGGYRRIAASLSQHGVKVTGKQIKTWLDRLREYPEFKDWLDRWGPEPEIKYEGDLYDFFLKIADPPAWRRKHRRLSRAGRE